MKIHNVFSLNFFLKISADQFQNQVNKSALLLIINNEKN